VSIVIPAYNEATVLGETLAHVRSALEGNESAGVACEFIVCDNNSSDATAKLAREAGAQVVLEYVNQISRARNRGASVASGEWLLFLDADSYPSVELVRELWEAIQSGAVIGCGTTVRVEGGTLFNKLRMERLNPFFRLFGVSGGALLLADAEAFRALGGFCTDLYAYEDLEFSIRLKRYGWKRSKEFCVLHRHPVVTSGRKGGYGFSSMLVLFASNFAAVILFFLHFLLPASVVRAAGSRLLGYWYRRRD